MPSDVNSLAHTRWNCMYHIVFAPMYRRQIICNIWKTKKREDTGMILRQLCERKGVEIIEDVKISYTYVGRYSYED